MNHQLVNSLVQIIESLTIEERQLLEERLDRKKNWESSKDALSQIHTQIAARHGGESINLSTEDIVEQIHQMREERIQQISNASLPVTEN